MKPDVGSPDFHDGHITAVTPDIANGRLEVTVRGYSGRYYIVRFEGVRSIESESLEGMLLYALHESDSGENALRLFTFLNWFDDEDDERSKSRLTVTAKNFTFQETLSESL
jgi:hypothetical protein